MTFNYTNTAACPVNSTALPPPESAGVRVDTRACAVLENCNDNADKLHQCCDNATGSLQYFIGDIGSGNAAPYVYCTIASREPDAYRLYQNCLLQAGVYPFHCNALAGETSNSCDPQGLPPSVLPSDGEESCSLRNGPNAAKALTKCCKGNSTDTIITSFDQGCGGFCVAPTGLYDCLTAEVGKDNVGCAYRGTDTSNDNTNNNNGGGGGGNNTGGAAATRPVGGFMKLGVLFLALAAFL